MSLIVSYSGLRGVVGDGLDAGVAARYGHAFGELVRESHAAPIVLVGRDTRTSGPELFQGLVKGLAPFATVIDLGVVPTPTVQLCVSALNAHAGVCITASHNTREWNGLKFFLGSPTIVLGGSEMKRLMARAPEITPATEMPTIENRHRHAINMHLERVLAVVDVDKIVARRFRVAIDSARGAGKEPTLRLLRALGCEIFEVDVERESEPIPEHLRGLVATTRAHNCDVGFAQDLDADRLALCNHGGELPGEDTTLVLAVDHLLQKYGKTTVVKNVATTRAVDDIVRKHDATLVETPVGEVNLSRALIAAGGNAFGGEGNGGVIWPRVLYGRDSLVGIALVLEAMLTPERSLPRYTMLKTKVPAPRDLEALFQEAITAFPTATVDRLDGLRLTFADGWLIIRASNTEPVVRVIAESKDPLWPDAVTDRIKNMTACRDALLIKR